MSVFAKVKEKVTSDKQSNYEAALAQKVIFKFREAKIAKQPYVNVWKECISAVKGDTNNKYPTYKADHNSNFIFAIVETIKPIMVDNDPKFMAIPNSSKYTKVADLVQLAMDYEWRREKMTSKLVEANTTSLHLGTCVWMVPWDPHADKGVGQVKPRLINIFNFFPDPMATCIEDAQYLIYATYMSIEEVKKRFPEKANLLVGGTIKEEDLVVGKMDTANVKNQVLIIECHTFEYDEFIIEEVEVQGKKVQNKKPKFPNGRVITCTDDGILLEDKENPYDDGEYPFIMWKNYQIPFEFWGMGEVQQLLKPQFYINDLNNQIIDNARLTGNMPWIVDKNAGIGEGKLTNRPGLVVRKNPGTEVGRMSPPTMPRYIQDKIDELKKDMEIISGIHDITQGRKPGGITAAAAIEALQEAGQARIRLKIKLMEQGLVEMGNKWFNRMKQFWVTTREIRRLNSDYTYSFEDINSNMLDGDIQFYVVAGSTMPVNRASRLQQMIQLAQTTAEDGKPIVDRQAVLETANIVDYDKILERLSKIQPPEPKQPAMPPGMMGMGMPQGMPMQQPQGMPQQMSMMQQGMPQQGASDIPPELMQLVQELSQMSDEEVQKVLAENPEIAEVVEQLQSSGITL